MRAPPTPFLLSYPIIEVDESKSFFLFGYYINFIRQENDKCFENNFDRRYAKLGPWDEDATMAVSHIYII